MPKVAAKKLVKTVKPEQSVAATPQKPKTKLGDLLSTRPVKALIPKADSKFTGFEPQWDDQPVGSTRNVKVGKAFTWYNYHYDKSKAKEFIIDFLTRSERSDQAKQFAKVPDALIVPQAGWIARMAVMGLNLSDREQQFLNDFVSQQITSLVPTRIAPVEDKSVTKITIQDRLREKAQAAGGEIEGIYDEFIMGKCKNVQNISPIDIFRAQNIVPQMISDIRKLWVSRREELFETLQGTDPQLVEGYSHYGRQELKNMIKFADRVVADCDSYVQLKKVERKPRKKKPVPPERQVAKFKYLREFAELKLKSVSSTELIGGTEAWLYDTKKRKLVHLVADTHIQSFTVKGSAIIGFDAVQSLQKTLRKPADQLKGIMSAGAPAARKFFKEIKATETKFNGRSNENMIILKVR